MENNMENNNEPLTWGFRQACEQMTAAISDWAPTLGKYFAALQLEGFSRQEAFILVRDWHNGTFGFPKQPIDNMPEDFWWMEDLEDSDEGGE